MLYPAPVRAVADGHTEQAEGAVPQAWRPLSVAAACPNDDACCR
jgi:hypothetical protein